MAGKGEVGGCSGNGRFRTFLGQRVPANLHGKHRETLRIHPSQREDFPHRQQQLAVPQISYTPPARTMDDRNFWVSGFLSFRKPGNQ